MPSQRTMEATERLRGQTSRMMTAQQIAFLRDVQGYLEFAIRNGLTFTTAMTGVVHDVNQMARFGFDDDAARSAGIKLKTAGFADLSDDDIGQTEEPDA